MKRLDTNQMRQGERFWFCVHFDIKGFGVAGVLEMLFEQKRNAQRSEPFYRFLCLSSR
jgi:hypothetical protein